MTVLSRKFYERDTVKVARELLGKKLVRKINNSIISGIITETEAYRFDDDPASHAYRGMTQRNRAMFEEVGKAYVYFTYGMYYCVNAVARSSRYDAGAVLIRSLQPKQGVEKMMKYRSTKQISNLTSGPAKLTQALKITKKQYGTDLTKRTDLYITEGVKTDKILVNPRIGIKNGTEKLWNFKIEI